MHFEERTLEYPRFAMWHTPFSKLGNERHAKETSFLYEDKHINFEANDRVWQGFKPCNSRAKLHILKVQKSFATKAT